MKQKLLLTIAALLSLAATQAQTAITTYPYVHQFNALNGTGAWTIATNLAEPTVATFTFGTDNVSAQSYTSTLDQATGNYYYEYYSADEWLTSPLFAINRQAMRFDLAVGATGAIWAISNVKFYVATTGGSVADFLATEPVLDTNLPYIGAGATLSIDLSDYYGDSIYIGVRYLEDAANSNPSALSVYRAHVYSVYTPVISLSDSYIMKGVGDTTTVWVTMHSGSTDGLEYAWNSNMMEASTADYMLSDSEDTITIIHNAAGYDTLVAYVINDYDTVTASVIFNVFDFNPAEVDYGQPYTVGFEEGEDESWVLFNNNGPNKWYIGSGAFNLGTSGLYVSNNEGVSDTYTYAISGGNPAYSLNYAVRAITINEAGEYKLNFSWRGLGEWGADYGRAYLVKDLGAGLPTTMMGTPEGWIEASNPLAYVSTWGVSSRVIDLDSSWVGTIYIVIAWTNDNYETGYGNTTAQSVAIDDLTFSRVTCITPTDFHTTNLGTESTDLTWTSRGSESAWAYCINDGEWDTVTSTSVSITGLASGTSYTAKLRAVCDEESSVEVSCTFRTECEMISTLPWIEDFEEYSHNYNKSITQYNSCIVSGRQATASTPYPIVYNPASWPGSNVLRIITSNPGTFCYMILPPCEAPLNTLELSLDMTTGSSDVSYLIIGALDSPDFIYDTTEFDTITTILVSQTIAYPLRNYVVNFSEYTGTGRYIMLLSSGDYPGNHGWFYIDNIDIHSAPACVKPTDLTRTGATDTSITVSWTSEATEFRAYLRATGGDGDWVEKTATTAEVTFGNLVPGTSYDIRVRAVCGPDDTSYAANGKFSTLCAIDDFPFAEPFAGSATAGCWVPLSTNNYSGDDWQVNTTQGFAIGNYSGSGSIANEYLVSPTIYVPSNVDDLFSLVFKYKDPYIAGYPNGNTIHVMVCVDANPLAVSNYTDTLLTITGLYDDWTKFTASLGQYAGHSINIAFHRTCGSQAATRVYITDIELRDADAPEIRANASRIANVGYPNVVTVELAEGDSVGLQYTWVSQMVAAGLATVSYDGDNTATYTYSATGNDTITIIAQNNYGLDTLLLPITVRDIHIITTLPYLTGFEDAADNALWTSVGDTNKWYTSSAAAKSGSNALYISNDGGLHNTYANNANYDTSYAHIYRGILLDSGDYIIDFDWMCGGSAQYAFFRTYLLPADAVLEGGKEISVKYNEEYFLDISGHQAGISGLFGSPAVWRNNIGIFTVTKPGLYILDFYWYSYLSVSNPSATIDNLNIHKYTCPDPVDFTLVSVTGTTGTFRWYRGGSENQWEVIVGDNDPVVVDTNYYTADGLEPNTAYNVSIRAICGEGDTSYALTATFNTDCEYITDLPWSEGYDGYAATDFETNVECWIHLGGARQTISDEVSLTGAATDHSMQIFRPTKRDSADFLTVLPKFHPTIQALEMSLYLAPDSGAAGTIEIGYITNLSNVFSFVPLATYSATDSATFFTVADGSFHFAHKTVSFLNAPDGSRMAIRNRVSGNHGGSWYIDSVVVKVIDGIDPYACAVPTDITVNKLFGNSYQIDWTAGSELKWRLEVTHDGETEVRDINNRPYIINQIQPDDNYYFRLMAICNLTAESDWSEVYHLNTETPIDTTTPEPPIDTTQTDTTTGISHVIAGSFGLRPNPATSSVTVSVSNVDGPVMVAIIDMNGRKRGEWTVDDSHLTVDLSGYARGAYFVRVVANQGTAVRKLIIQ